MRHCTPKRGDLGVKSPHFSYNNLFVEKKVEESAEILVLLGASLRIAASDTPPPVHGHHLILHLVLQSSYAKYHQLHLLLPQT